MHCTDCIWPSSPSSCFRGRTKRDRERRRWRKPTPYVSCASAVPNQPGHPTMQMKLWRFPASKPAAALGLALAMGSALTNAGEPAKSADAIAKELANPGRLARQPEQQLRVPGLQGRPPGRRRSGRLVLQLPAGAALPGRQQGQENHLPSPGPGEAERAGLQAGEARLRHGRSRPRRHHFRPGLCRDGDDRPQGQEGVPVGPWHGRDLSYRHR